MKYLVCLVFLITCGPLSAQNVPVRSGEHGDFTRLVLDAPAGTGWQVEGEGRARSIVLSVPSARIDPSAVFSRIPRDRINAISAIGPRLNLQLGCDCSLSVFNVGQRMIVVDVKPGNEPEQGEQDRRLLTFGRDFPFARMTGNALSFATSSGAAENVRSGDAAPAEPRQDDRQIPVPNNVARAALPSAIGDLLVTDTFPVAPLEPDLDTAGREMIEQIGRAASQGLLTPVSGLKTASSGGVTDTDVVQPRSLAPILEGQANIRATTSVDASARTPNRAVDILDGRNCIPDRRMDVRSWADPSLDLVHQIGQYRSELYGEFDEVVSDAALRLAKLYVHYGFGAEAIATLELVDEKDPDKHLVGTLAHIVDGGTYEAANPMAGQESCSGRSAFWAMLSSESVNPPLGSDDSSILRALNELPDDLRIHLGPLLAERMLALGNSELSRNALRMASRAVDAPTEQMEIADAQLLLSAGKTAEAKEKLTSVANSDGDLSPAALIALIDTEMDEMGSVSASIASHIEALLRENKGTEIEPGLRRALTLAFALGSDFAAAADTLADSYAHSTGADREKFEADYFRLLADRANDADLLKGVLTAKASVPSNVDKVTGNRIAERLIEAGLPEHAEEFLERGAEGTAGRERRILRARIALETGRPRRAEADLMGLAGPDVDSLRGQARRASQDYAGAVQFLAASGEVAAAAEAAWIGGLWGDAAELNQGLFSDAAQLAATEGLGSDRPSDDEPARESLPEEPVLQRNRALLSRSAELRDLYTGLIQETEVTTALAE